MANYEQIARNMFRTATLVLVGEIALGWLVSDASAARPFGPSPAVYVDCAKQPSGSVHVQFDALRPQQLFVGDVQTDTSGRPEKWRTIFGVDTIFHDAGQIGVVTEGAGPVVSYDSLPKDFIATPLRALVSSEGDGPLLNMSQTPHEPTPTHNPVSVTFTCGPAAR